MGDEGGGEVQAKKKGKKVKSQVEEEEDDDELQKKRDAEDAERLKRIEELRKRQSQLVNSLNQLQIATKPDPSDLKEGAESNNKGNCSIFFNLFKKSTGRRSALAQLNLLAKQFLS